LSTNLKESQRAEEEWSNLNRERRESVDFSLSIDKELFPIVAGVGNGKEVSAHLEARLSKLPKQKLITERFNGLIQRIEQILGGGEDGKGKLLPKEKEGEAKEVLSDLRKKLKALEVSSLSNISCTCFSFRSSCSPSTNWCCICCQPSSKTMWS